MKLVIKMESGGVAIMSVVDGANPDDCIEKFKATVPGYISHREMPDRAIPTDRSFRSAWADNTPELVLDIDLAKARAIHLERIRLARNAELSRLDIEAIKAQDQGDNDALVTIRAQKQKLRDLPAILGPALEVADNVEAILAIAPV